MKDTIRQRREEPQDDLITYLVNTSEDEYHLDDEGIVGRPFGSAHGQARQVQHVQDVRIAQFTAEAKANGSPF